jgi:hypothetical protein
VKEYTGFPVDGTPSKSTVVDRRQKPVASALNSIRCTLAGAWSLATHRRMAFWNRKVWGDVVENEEPALRAVNLLVTVPKVPAEPTR